MLWGYFFIHIYRLLTYRISIECSKSAVNQSGENIVMMCAQQVKAIADTGCKVVVTGGKVGEMYLHYANKYRLMVVRLLTKFDLRRLCKSIGATALPRLVSMLFAYCVACLLNENILHSCFLSISVSPALSWSPYVVADIQVTGWMVTCIL